jgi:hypothetical protein
MDAISRHWDVALSPGCFRVPLDIEKVRDAELVTVKLLTVSPSATAVALWSSRLS